MKRFLLFMLLIPAFLMAQTEQRYLAGAVPVVDGKVVFSKEIKAPSLSEQAMYDILQSWASTKFNTPENRVVYSNREKGDIAITGEDYLVFSSTALSLDRTQMIYRMTIKCENQYCLMAITGIRYEYNVSYQSSPEKYLAEEWITDKYALNKGKLNRISGKFRRSTIDYVDQLFKEAEAALGSSVLATPTATATPAAATVPATVATPVAPVATVAPVAEVATTPAAALIPATVTTAATNLN
ncbi:MAG: DUF4468 domain-containing protein, partial [Tannerellaceae bacterium]